MVGMDFPLLTLLDTEAIVAWIEQHFHPDGFGCSHCQAQVTYARLFRTIYPSYRLASVSAAQCGR